MASFKQVPFSTIEPSDISNVAVTNGRELGVNYFTPYLPIGFSLYACASACRARPWVWVRMGVTWLKWCHGLDVGVGVVVVSSRQVCRSKHYSSELYEKH